MVKRIIAREGLIIITLLFLAGIAFFVEMQLNKHKNLYEANVQRIEAFIPDKDPTVLRGSSQGIILRFPKNTDKNVINQTIKRDFPNLKEGDWVTHKNGWPSPPPKGKEDITVSTTVSYDEKGKQVFNSIIYKIKWSYVWFFFLVFAYPLYLTIRFVIWAIGTLKKRD
jgi:hypothetical protein